MMSRRLRLEMAVVATPSPEVAEGRRRVGDK